jgi:hypothetical protein
METTKIKPIRSLEELDSLALGSKVAVVDPFYSELWQSQKKVMTFGGKNKRGYSFLLGRDFGIPGVAMEIDELEVRKENIVFDRSGILQTQSSVIYGCHYFNKDYQEKLKIIKMGETQ